MGAGRPSFLVEARRVPVVLEGGDVEEAKRRDLNISEVCREALKRELGRRTRAESERKGDRLAKFRGLPLHVVGNIKDVVMRKPARLPRTLESINSFYGRSITADDARELLPVF